MLKIFLIYALVFMAACQSPSMEDNRTVNISARVQRSSELHVDLYSSVSIVKITLVAGSYSSIQSHPFTDRSCEFFGVPVGVPYTMTFQGIDEAGVVIWRGVSVGTTSAPQTSDGINSNSITVVVTNSPSTGEFTDVRDGIRYKYVTIGSQIWMAENLNHEVSGSQCLNNSTDSCIKYGRLYQWSAAMGLPEVYNTMIWGQSDLNVQGVCPSGWHLPSDAEWTLFGNFVDSGTSTSSLKLRSKSGWIPSSGTDIYGFNALPSIDGSTMCVFWSSTEVGESSAMTRLLNINPSLMTTNTTKSTTLMSVRCIKNKN